MNHPTTHLFKWMCVLAVALLSLGPTKPALAQGQTGAIKGSVTDPNGAVLKGAQVSIESNDVHVVTDEQGLFLITGLPPGKYTLTISYVGFAILEKEVDVAVGRTANVDARRRVTGIGRPPAPCRSCCRS